MDVNIREQGLDPDSGPVAAVGPADTCEGLIVVHQVGGAASSCRAQIVLALGEAVRGGKDPLVSDEAASALSQHGCECVEICKCVFCNSALCVRCKFGCACVHTRCLCTCRVCTCVSASSDRAPTLPYLQKSGLPTPGRAGTNEIIPPRSGLQQFWAKKERKKKMSREKDRINTYWCVRAGVDVNMPASQSRPGGESGAWR